MNSPRDSVSREDYERTLTNFHAQPRAVALAGGRWPEPVHRYALVACVRWETRYIIEWLDYHRSLGFDHAYIYCNDDDPRELYQALLPYVGGERPYVTFVHYRFVGSQHQMYLDFLWRHSPETQHYMFLDIDEFLCLRGVDHIDVFMQKFPEVDALYFNWVHFGHNGHATRPPGNVLTQYTRRERGVNVHTKVLARSRRAPYAAFFRRLGYPLHHDCVVLDPTLRAVNVLGMDMAGYYAEFPASGERALAGKHIRERILGCAFVAHFNIKSEEDFELRARRSVQGSFVAQKSWAKMSAEARLRYFESTNAVEDRYLAEYWNRLVDRAWSTSLYPPSRWPLLSEGRPADQSSVLYDGTTAEDAGNIVANSLTGQPQNHTQEEDAPWWQVDLGEVHRIHEMRLYNRLSLPVDRVTNIQLEGSADGTQWRIFHIKNDDRLYGGIDGTPYVWVDVTGFRARYLRITLLRRTFLHFDRIEFYGQ